MESYKREFIEFLEGAGVLKFGDFTAKSGRKIPYFINAGDIKTGGQIARLGEFYAKAYLEKIGHDKTVLYGPAYKGIPIAVSAACALSGHGLDLPFFFNRKEAKDHGEGGVIVGKQLADGEKELSENEKKLADAEKEISDNEKKLNDSESELKNAREELKIAYKEQLKEEKEFAIKAKKENQDKILKAIDESGMSTEEILVLLKNNKENNVGIQGE